MSIRIVDDQECPICSALWGHPDKDLDFPNRPKVGDADGTWWWRCYNPKCACDMYAPDIRAWEGNGYTDIPYPKNGAIYIDEDDKVNAFFNK